MKHNRTECIHILKKSGGKINTDQGYFVSSSIHNAAFLGNSEEVRWLLSQNKNLVNLPDYDLRTPLHLAASEGHAEVVKILLEYGGNIDVVDRWAHTPYHDAVRYRRHECATLLKLKIPAMDPREKITKSKSGHFNEETPLLAFEMNGGDNVTSKSNETHDSWKIDMSNNIRKDEKKALKELNAADRALFHAASDGDLGELKKLVKRGANINLQDYDGRSILHLCVSAGHLKLVQYLVSCKGIIIDVFDRFGNTPIQDAIDRGYVKISNLLRSSGATIRNPSLANQLCKLASEGNLVELQRLEIAVGIDINVADYDGRTALHLATCNNHIEIVNWIVSVAGRSLKASRDRYGNTALDDAKRYGYSDIVNVLGDAFKYSRR